MIEKVKEVDWFVVYNGNGGKLIIILEFKMNECFIYFEII